MASVWTFFHFTAMILIASLSPPPPPLPPNPNTLTHSHSPVLVRGHSNYSDKRNWRRLVFIPLLPKYLRIVKISQYSSSYIQLYRCINIP